MLKRAKDSAVLYLCLQAGIIVASLISAILLAAMSGNLLRSYGSNVLSIEFLAPQLLSLLVGVLLAKLLYKKVTAEKPTKKIILSTVLIFLVLNIITTLSSVIRSLIPLFLHPTPQLAISPLQFVYPFAANIVQVIILYILLRLTFRSAK